ncbi:hypothetical protein DFH94DRAFT_853754, partial [Russula ochroleuca]
MATLGSARGLYGDTCPFRPPVHSPQQSCLKKRWEDLTGWPLLVFFGIVPITANDGAPPPEFYNNQRQRPCTVCCGLPPCNSTYSGVQDCPVTVICTVVRTLDIVVLFQVASS